MNIVLGSRYYKSRLDDGQVVEEYNDIIGAVLLRDGDVMMVNLEGIEPMHIDDGKIITDGMDLILGVNEQDYCISIIKTKRILNKNEMVTARAVLANSTGAIFNMILIGYDKGVWNFPLHFSIGGLVEMLSLNINACNDSCGDCVCSS